MFLSCRKFAIFICVCFSKMLLRLQLWKIKHNDICWKHTLEVGGHWPLTTATKWTNISSYDQVWCYLYTGDDGTFVQVEVTYIYFRPYRFGSRDGTTLLPRISPSLMTSPFQSASHLLVRCSCHALDNGNKRGNGKDKHSLLIHGSTIESFTKFIFE